MDICEPDSMRDEPDIAVDETDMDIDILNIPAITNIFASEVFNPSLYSPKGYLAKKHIPSTSHTCLSFITSSYPHYSEFTNATY